MIRAIIFDCFGVLYQGSLQYLLEVCPAHDRQQLRDYSRQFDYGIIDHAQFMQFVADLTLKSPDDIRRIMETAHIRNQDLVDYSQQLRSGGYQVGLLSNIGRGMMDGLFTPDELEALFDGVVLSGEVGAIKPDPAIYEYAARELDIAIESCLMIDDSPGNITGAENAGMKGLVYTDTAQLIRDVKNATNIY